MTRFRVVTYNIHRCRGMDWKVNPRRVADVVAKLDGDLIALQEVFEDQISTLESTIRQSAFFGATRVLRGRNYGNLVFSRFPISKMCNLDLSVSRREPRRCLRVDVTLPEQKSIHFFALHLGTSFLERREQSHLLLSEEVLQSPDLHTVRVVAGDFNEWTRGLATRALEKELLGADVKHHLGDRRTYPGLFPLLHLDHIYFDPPLMVRKLILDNSSLARIASDHLPLIADFEWL